MFPLSIVQIVMMPHFPFVDDAMIRHFGCERVAISLPCSISTRNRIVGAVKMQ